jgi:rSAM/selenodomain-associated transferase 2
VVSFVIPTLNEEKLLPRTLAALAPQVRGGSSEILVVDGGSSDATTRVAAALPEVRVLEIRSGRGRQLNAGARAARGSLLVFLPSDTSLPPGSVDVLDEIDRRGVPLAGGFRQRFDRDRLSLRCISTLHNLRARITGVCYGDQVPFIRKDLFHEMGGFSEDIDMEDVEFGTRLKRRFRPRLLPLNVITSSRRFDQLGDVRAVIEATRLLACWVFLRRVPRSSSFFEQVR